MPDATRQSSAIFITTDTSCCGNIRNARRRWINTESILETLGAGKRRDEQFSTICNIARDHGKPVRIGVNGGSLNQELVMRKMQENTDGDLGFTSEEIINDCMVISAVESTELALQSGLREDQIIISCKTSRPLDLIAVYRKLSAKTQQPLHLGLTEAGMGLKGIDVVVGGDGRAAATKESATRFAFRSRRGRAAIAAKKCTRRANCCSRWGCGAFRRA